MRFMYDSHPFYRTVTKCVTTDSSLNRKLPGWIMFFLVDHASSTWPERKKDKFKAMIDKIQKVRGWLDVEMSLQWKHPGGALFIFWSLMLSCIFLEHALLNWHERFWSAAPHQTQLLAMFPVFQSFSGASPPSPFAAAGGFFRLISLHFPIFSGGPGLLLYLPNAKGFLPNNTSRFSFASLVDIQIGHHFEKLPFNVFLVHVMKHNGNCVRLHRMVVSEMPCKPLRVWSPGRDADIRTGSYASAVKCHHRDSWRPLEFFGFFLTQHWR